jgi:Na+/proline symporter
MGVFWKRANKWGAIIGMAAGLAVCVYYMVTRYPFFGINMPLWYGLSPVSAGMFGLPAGLITIFVVSLLTPAPSREVQELVEHVRYPHLGDTCHEADELSAIERPLGGLFFSDEIFDQVLSRRGRIDNQPSGHARISAAGA